MLIRKLLLNRWVATILVINQFRSLHESFSTVWLVAFVRPFTGVTPNMSAEVSLMNERLRADMTCVWSFTWC